MTNLTPSEQNTLTLLNTLGYEVNQMTTQLIFTHIWDGHYVVYLNKWDEFDAPEITDLKYCVTYATEEGYFDAIDPQNPFIANSGAKQVLYAIDPRDYFLELKKVRSFLESRALSCETDMGKIVLKFKI